MAGCCWCNWESLGDLWFLCSPQCLLTTKIYFFAAVEKIFMTYMLGECILNLWPLFYNKNLCNMLIKSYLAQVGYDPGPRTLRLPDMARVPVSRLSYTGRSSCVGPPRLAHRTGHEKGVSSPVGACPCGLTARGMEVAAAGPVVENQSPLPPCLQLG